MGTELEEWQRLSSDSRKETAPFLSNENMGSGHGSGNAVNSSRSVTQATELITKPLDILDLQLLTILNKEPKSGYELRKDLHRLFDIDVSFGTLYPHLSHLIDAKLVVGEWRVNNLGRNKKKLLALTELGKETLRENLKRFERTASIIQSLAVTIG
jgi:DNA-binding PadR family transcriptional regulator